MVSKFLVLLFNPSGCARTRARSGGCAYVVTNSIRHLDELHSPNFVSFSISKFERTVLLCIEADLRDQIRVGECLTRSTWRLCISKMYEIYKFNILLATSNFEIAQNCNFFLSSFLFNMFCGRRRQLSRRQAKFFSKTFFFSFFPRARA